MRIATLILSIAILVPMSLQSCTAFFLSGIAVKLGTKMGEQNAAASSGGVFASVLTLLALAFVWGYPLAAMVLYFIGALLAFSSALLGFTDMKFWGFILLVFCVFSFLGWREKQKKVSMHAG